MKSSAITKRFFTLKRTQYFCVLLTLMLIAIGAIKYLDSKDDYRLAISTYNIEYNKLPRSTLDYDRDYQLKWFLVVDTCEEIFHNLNPYEQKIIPSESNRLVPWKRFKNIEKLRKEAHLESRPYQEQKKFYEEKVKECIPIQNVIAHVDSLEHKIVKAKSSIESVINESSFIILLIWLAYVVIHLLTKFIIRFRQPIVGAMTGTLRFSIYMVLAIVPLAIAIALGIWVYSEILK